MLFATEQIRRMRGGAQSHLMRCSDGHYYIVKFQNNLQHRRILVNEVAGNKIGGAAGAAGHAGGNCSRQRRVTLSVTRAPQDAKSLAYNVKHIADKARYHTEFAAVTDVRLARENDRHRFVLDTLGEAGIEPVPTEDLAVWVARLRPCLLQ